MDEVFSRYLDPAFRYVSSQSRARARSRDDALRDGLNCAALAHLVIREPGRVEVSRERRRNAAAVRRPGRAPGAACPHSM